MNSLESANAPQGGIGNVQRAQKAGKTPQRATSLSVGKQVEGLK
jgi:hypothetical protein